MRQVDGLGGEGWYLHRDRPTDRVDLHHLRERRRDETEERREEVKVTGERGEKQEEEECGGGERSRRSR